MEASELIMARLTLKNIKNKGKRQKNVFAKIIDKKKLEITWDNITETSPTFTFKEFLDDNNINKIDFLKCDCEGGEYDVFSKSNIEFLKTIDNNDQHEQITHRSL